MPSLLTFSMINYVHFIFSPGLVRDATTAIWCSHRGMSESELLTLLDVSNVCRHSNCQSF